MLQDSYTPVLPGFESYTVGMREIVCDCGCGQTFYQPKVGRTRRYLNKAHKAAAYKAKSPVKEAVKVSTRLGLMFDNVDNPLFWPDDLTDAQMAFISEAQHNPLTVLSIIRLIREMEAE